MVKDYRKFVYDENQRFIFPTSDWGFKYLFATEKNKDILIGVLNRLLPGWDIVDLEYLPRDITIPVGKMRDATFDVHCELADGSRVIVEMQNYAKRTFIDRSVVYSSAAVLEHFINSKSEGYKIGRTVFIAFTGDLLYGGVNHSPVRIGLCDLDNPETTVLNDKLLQIFVELPKFAGSIEDIRPEMPFVEKLAYVLMEMPSCREIPDNLDDELLKKIFEASDTNKFNEMEKKDYKSKIMSELDYRDALEDARLDGIEEGFEEGREEGRALGLQQGIAEGLKQGKAEGLKQGKAEGLKQGKAEGLKQGKAEGSNQEKKKIAVRMKAAGMDPKLITEITGLSAEHL